MIQILVNLPILQLDNIQNYQVIFAIINLEYNKET